MDIDPLWALGGCRFLLSSFCMAKTNTTSSSSSSSYTSSSYSRDHCYTKSTHPFVLYLSFLFIFLLLARPADQIRQSHMVSEPATETLPTSTGPSSSSPSTTSVQPQKAKHGKTLPSKQFEASEHEVPSGPNPISNR